MSPVFAQTPPGGMSPEDIIIRDNRDWSFSAPLGAAATFVVLSGVDYFAAPELLSRFFIYRLFIVVFLVGYAFVAKRLLNSARKLRIGFFLIIIASSATIELMILDSGAHASPYYALMILLSVFTATSSFPVVAIIGANLSIYLIYLLPVLVLDRIDNIGSFVTTNSFLLCCMGVVILIHRSGRIRYCQKLRLKNEITRLQKKVAGLALKMNREIIRRKNMQTEIISLERMASLGEISGRIAHEVLNPITGILLRVEENLEKRDEFNHTLDLFLNSADRWRHISRPGAAPDSPAEERKSESDRADLDFEQVRLLGERLREMRSQRHSDLEFIHKQIARVVRIVNALRESARTSRTLKPVLIDRVIREAREIFEDAVNKRGIQIHEQIPADLPGILADENELIQVFLNLLRNSIHGIDERAESGGQISIRAVRKDNELCIYFADNGIGIPYSDRERIFESGYSTKDSEHGTGLGLSISRRFIERIGGKMTLIRSSDETGAEFLIRLPWRGEED